jgi:hypothetical protein
MRTFLIILVAAALIYALAAGLGLTHGRKKGLAKKITVIDDFEDADNDFDWFTGGYAKLEQSNQNQSHGKHSAKVTFYTPNQFVATPTPTETWQPEIVMDTRSVTKLPVFEWQDYTSLKMDVFNPQDQPVTYHLKLTDAKSFNYETNGVMLSKKVTNIAVPLDNLSQARMDLSSMSSIQFWVDMTGATQPVSVYIDYLRLEFDPGEVKKK